MCGIVGVLSCERSAGSIDRDRFMRQALICGTLRGFDSTGLMLVDQTQTIDTFKTVFAGPDFVQLKPVNKILNNTQEYKAIIGHHRYKTNGNISRFEAHPHEHEHITLVHNGGIENSYQLPGYKHDNNEPVVDTFRLTKAIATSGAMNVLPFIEGTYALVWWDANERALYMTRNAHRPLAIIWQENKKAVYIASEWEMLAWLVKRNAIKVEKNCKTLQEMVLYKFKVNETSIEMEKTGYTKKLAPKENIGHGHGRTRFYPGFSGVNTRDPDYEGQFDGDYDDLDWQPGYPKHSPGGVNQRPQLALPGVDRNTNIVKTVVIKPDYPIITVIPDDRKPTGKKLERITRLLKEHQLVYGAQIWCIPDNWTPYNGEKNANQGIAEFLYGPEHVPVHIHNMTNEEWQAVMASGLLTSTIIIDVTHNKQTLVGRVDWEGQGGVERFIASIDLESTFRFIPFKTGEYITKSHFYRLTNHGCSSCKQVIKLDGADRTEWIDELPVCGECSGQIPRKKEENVDAAATA